eukprot:7309226-Ditylum_brightwellii.AAC.1
MSQVTEDTNGNKNQKDGDVKKNEMKGANTRKSNGYTNDNGNNRISQEEDYEEEEESGSEEKDEDSSNGDLLNDEVDKEDTLITQSEENDKSKAVTMSPQVCTRKQRLLALSQSGAIDPGDAEHQE